MDSHEITVGAGPEGATLKCPCGWRWAPAKLLGRDPTPAELVEYAKTHPRVARADALA
jgi:hypothetical protein